MLESLRMRLSLSISLVFWFPVEKQEHCFRSSSCRSVVGPIFGFNFGSRFFTNCNRQISYDSYRDHCIKLKSFPYKYFCIRSDTSSIPAKVRKLNILTPLTGTSKFQDTALNRIRILFIGFVTGQLLLTNVRVEYIVRLMLHVAWQFLWQKRHLKLARHFSRIYCEICVLYVHFCLHSVASVINYASILTW